MSEGERVRVMGKEKRGGVLVSNLFPMATSGSDDGEKYISRLALKIQPLNLPHN